MRERNRQTAPLHPGRSSPVTGQIETSHKLDQRDWASHLGAEGRSLSGHRRGGRLPSGSIAKTWDLRFDLGQPRTQLGAGAVRANGTSLARQVKGCSEDGLTEWSGASRARGPVWRPGEEVPSSHANPLDPEAGGILRRSQMIHAVGSDHWPLATLPLTQVLPAAHERCLPDPALTSYRQWVGHVRAGADAAMRRRSDGAPRLRPIRVSVSAPVRGCYCMRPFWVTGVRRVGAPTGCQRRGSTRTRDLPSCSPRTRCHRPPRDGPPPCGCLDPVGTAHRLC